MHIEGKRILERLLRKNRGNSRLAKAVDQLIEDLETNSTDDIGDFLKTRNDADRVHSKGLYFFNLHVHRTLVFIEIKKNQAEVVWAGTHDEYVRVFKNNANTIEKWLRANTTWN